MAGPVTAGVVRISTAKLNQVVQYEPKDLTISVRAGMRYADLSQVLAANGQMIPLDGPFDDQATVGGMVAANISGSRRRGYGTARDWVIGMQFATMDGKLVQSGGMVVKNVAGLDMGKLMIGSFGTLAAITTVNFKLAPIPAATITVVLPTDGPRPAFKIAAESMRGALNPVAVDVLNPQLASLMGLESRHTVVLAYAGNTAVVERTIREFSSKESVQTLRGQQEAEFWASVRDITPTHLTSISNGAVARVSVPLKGAEAVMETVSVPCLAHAGSGVLRGWFHTGSAAAAWVASATLAGAKGVVEFSPNSTKSPDALWPAPGGDFEIMKQVKQMFDPNGLLNHGRLYGRI